VRLRGWCFGGGIINEAQVDLPYRQIGQLKGLWGGPTLSLTAAKHWVSQSGERAVLSSVLAALFFAGIHLGIAGTATRDRAIGILGENGYRAAFAVASVIGLGWLVAAYDGAPYLVTWGMLEWWKAIAIILMPPASLLVVIGLMTPTRPRSRRKDASGNHRRGIVRITRHPFLTGGGPLGAGASD
jgi:hypothetical protein